MLWVCQVWKDCPSSLLADSSGKVYISEGLVSCLLQRHSIDKTSSNNQYPCSWIGKAIAQSSCPWTTGDRD